MCWDWDNTHTHYTVKGHYRFVIETVIFIPVYHSSDHLEEIFITLHKQKFTDIVMQKTTRKVAPDGGKNRNW